MNRSDTTPCLYCGRQRTRPPLSLRRGPVFKTGRRSNAAALSSILRLRQDSNLQRLALEPIRKTIELPSLFSMCGGQGTRTLTSTFVEVCVSSAVQQTDICLSSLSGVRGEQVRVKKSHVSPLTSHLSPLRANSWTRTSTFSLEDCNATVTPCSPFNAGGEFI